MTSSRFASLSRSLIAGLAVVAACSGDDGPNDEPAGTQVELSYCIDRPSWVAVQDGDGPWTRVLPVAEGKYEATFRSGRGGVATVALGGTALQVNYGTLAELGYIRCDNGYKYVTGTVSGVPFPDRAIVSLGGSHGLVVRDTVKLWYVAEGAQDLFAIHRRSGAAGTELSLIMRRDLDAPGNTYLPAIDFDSPEAFAPTLATFSVTNQGSGLPAVADVHWYGRGAAQANLMTIDLDGATSGQYAAVPLARLAPGDLAALGAYATDGPQAGRYALEYFRAPPDITIEMGAALNPPTVTFPAGGPTLRPRVQLASQADYGRMVYVNFYQSYYASASVAMTSGYMGGTPATWDIEVPDLSAAEGWNPAWGLVPSLTPEWSLTAEGGPDRWLGDVVHDGDVFFSANYSGSVPAAARLSSVSARPEPHRGGYPTLIKP